MFLNTNPDFKIAHWQLSSSLLCATTCCRAVSPLLQPRITSRETRIAPVCVKRLIQRVNAPPVYALALHFPGFRSAVRYFWAWTHPKEQRRKAWLKLRISMVWPVTHGDCNINTEVQPKCLLLKEESFHSAISRQKVFGDVRMNHFMRFVLLFKSLLSRTDQTLNTQKNNANNFTFHSYKNTNREWRTMMNSEEHTSRETIRTNIICHWFLSSEAELFFTVTLKIWLRTFKELGIYLEIAVCLWNKC